MAHPQKIHPEPSRKGDASLAQTAASALHGHETNSHREPPPQWIPTGVTQTIRRNQLRLLVPLADSTIYEMEQRGEFPRRFSLTSRCVVWDLAEVEAWIEQRKRDSWRVARLTLARTAASWHAKSVRDNRSVAA